MKKTSVILIGVVIYAATLVTRGQLPFYWAIALFLMSYLLIGGDILLKAAKNILRGEVFDENFLMSISTIGAFAIGEYPEAVAVMLFFKVGEFFQDYAVDKSRKSIADLMDIRPDHAYVYRGEELINVNPSDVNVGDIIAVKPGERVPLDAVVVKGNSTMDTSALTGESLPREVSVDSDILSGCINLSGLITARVTKAYGESTAAKILELVENAASKKSESENFITKFARIYTPAVVVIAVLLALLPPLFLNGATFADWIYRALTFLVISCPCALVISIPLSFFGGIGGASMQGVLVKGGNYLESLAKTEIVVFDKTGTLTKGVFSVTRIHAIDIAQAELLELAALVESGSNHPIAVSLRKAYNQEIDLTRVGATEEIAGRGIKATIDGVVIHAGNAKLMDEIGVDYEGVEQIGTVVHIAKEQRYAGYIVISDEIKPDARSAIAGLKGIGIKQTVMLTGDSASVGEKVAKELGMDAVYSQLLPADKVTQLEKLLRDKSRKGKLAFVGDGINDAPVLARADIGIAMGGLGSDAAIEAADVVIMTDEPSKIITAIKISKKTLAIAMENICFALLVKAFVLILGACGVATMWEAVFADVGVAMIAILNAMRAMRAVK